MELLYTIFLLPIETIMKLVLEIAYKFTNNYGISIIILSLVTTISLIPFFNLANKWRKKDIEFREVMKYELEKIKRNYSGKEKHYYIQAVYKIHKYNQLYSLKASAGFLIQIPFFIAAFHLLLNYEPINGVSFGILSDLGKPDNLLFGINLLPFIMTFVNLLGSYIMINNSDRNAKYQALGIAILFLVLLYTQASALLLYWTFNNIFSLFKNLIEKNLKLKFHFKQKLNFLKFDIKNKNMIYLLLFLIPFTLLFLVPLHIANQSENGWDYFNRDIFFICSLIYFCLLVSFEVLLISLAYLAKLKKLIIPTSIFILTWIVLSGFIFPIAESKGMVEADSVTTDLNNLIIVFLGSCLIVLIGVIKNYKLPIIFNIAIILFAIVDISLGSITHSEKSNKNELETIKKFKTISQNNIMVLSFDGIPNFIFQNVINNNEEFKEIFKDFTLFTEAFSTAPATTASIRSSLFGNINFRKEGDRGKEIDLTKEYSKLPNNILEDSYSYGAYSTFRKNNQNKFPVNYYSKKYQNVPNVINSFYLIHISLSRVFSSLSFKTLQRLGVENYSKNKVFSILPKSEVDYILSNYKNANWDLNNTLNKYDFENIIKNLNVDSKKTNKISLREMHFLHTHFPVDFDENCNLQSTSKSWVDNNQNYKGLYNQTICAAKQFSSFIQKLKQLRVYDKTLIILKSDHGEPATYFKDIPNGYKINNHSLWGYNRYKPLLMVKDFNKQQESMKEDLSFVGLPDIAKTICLKSNLENCNYFNGVNLLSENIQKEIIENRYVYIDVVIDEKSDFKSETHKTIKIDRSKYSNILEAFRNENGINLTIELLNTKQRKKDLIEIKEALEKFYIDNGSYPISKGFDGIYTNWGDSSVDWIKNLTPKYIDKLPIDPRNTKNPNFQYLYKSNGKDYKLISHSPEDCEEVKKIEKNLIDLQRDCWAYGYWTEGAIGW